MPASPQAARRQAMLSPTHYAIATAAAIGSLSVMMLGGQFWSTALPASSAIFAAALAASVAFRDFGPHRAAALAPAAASVDPANGNALDRLKGLVTRHDSAGMLLSVHGADRQSFGFGRQRIEATAFIDQVHIGSRITFLTAIDALRQGQSEATADLLFAGKDCDGGYRPVRVEMSAERGADGSFAGFLAQTRDMATEARLRGDIVKWQAEARSANEAKTRFLAAVSHELRTPLNAILGFSDILAGEYFGKLVNDRQKEYVELINQSGHHLLAVVNSMLDMSRIEAGRYDLVKEPFQVADAVSTVQEMLSLQARAKGVILTTRIARGLADLVADRRALQQVLINLAGNAIKFTGPGGVVAIDAAAEGNDLVLAVSDTGIGIPADKLSQVGKPFMQVRNDYTRPYEGTGLGLALVKGLVALHGGTFAIESQEGNGTVVTVRLPMNGETASAIERIDFPPRLESGSTDREAGKVRHGAAEAKIA